MALTADQLAQVRRMINEPTDVNGWTDPVLLAAAEAFFVDDVYNLRALSASLWEEKAAKVADLVKVSESGSTREMQQVFDHYMKMAARFGTAPSEEVVSATTYPRSTRIVRPAREA